MKTNKNETVKKTELAAIVIMMAMGSLPVASSAQVQSISEGGLQGGGGDTQTEGRINDIRSDILQWVKDGGAKAIKFESGMTYDMYFPAMTQMLAKQAVVVSAITTREEKIDDEELNTNVAGQPKTCKGFISKKDGLPHILCNVERFATTSESDQYRLVHHEYAGLARVEKNVGAASDYEISTQITSSLVPMTVLRLAVKKEPAFIHSADSVVVINQTNPEDKIIFQCVGTDCTKVEMSTISNGKVTDTKTVAISAIKNKLCSKLEVTQRDDQAGGGLSNLTPYEFSSMTVKGGYGGTFFFETAGRYMENTISDDWKSGYEGRAIWRSSVRLLFSVVIDSIVLPYSSLNYLYMTKNDRQLHRKMKKFLRILKNGKDLEMKDRQFEKFRTTIFSHLF